MGDLSRLLADWRDDHARLQSELGRYDSTPNGADPNDPGYSAVLLWKS